MRRAGDAETVEKFSKRLVKVSFPLHRASIAHACKSDGDFLAKSIDRLCHHIGRTAHYCALARLIPRCLPSPLRLGARVRRAAPPAARPSRFFVDGSNVPGD